MNEVNLPKHIAVIMDGNGRWAKKRLLPRTMGHKAGAKAVRTLIENCVRLAIPALTLFAFSSENWQRPSDEIATLMDLFIEHLHSELPLFEQHNIKFQVIGDLAKFSDALQQQIGETVIKTAKNTGLILTIAVSYSGRWDIIQAIKKVVALAENNQISAAEINEQTIAPFFCLADMPEPDLFIRSSGEQRISNFLLWQLAYTELYFTEELWPDFDSASFDRAINWFQQRQRRFGKISEQIEQ